MEFFDTSINGAIVHVDDLLAFFAVVLDDGVFQVFNSVFYRMILARAKKAAA